MLALTLIFSLIVLLNIFWPMNQKIMIAITLLIQAGLMAGQMLSTSNALAVALSDYKMCIGAASSIFGFYYYTIISMITLMMGFLHNGTLLPMPLFFLSIVIMMILVSGRLARIEAAR